MRKNVLFNTKQRRQNHILNRGSTRRTLENTREMQNLAQESQLSLVVYNFQNFYEIN